MGTGCGILTILSAQKARRVVGIDINPYAVQCTKLNSRINGVAEKIHVIRGDLFKPIQKETKFDLILFNAPYVPVLENESVDWIDYAWGGGKDGRESIDRFLVSAPKYMKRGGIMLLVQSTLANVSSTVEKLNSVDESRLITSIVAEKKIAFETITLIQAKKTR